MIKTFLNCLRMLFNLIDRNLNKIGGGWVSTGLSILGILGLGAAVLGFVAFVVLVPGIALAYDLNHLVPLLTHKPLNVNWYNPIVLIVGFLTARIVVPLWLFVVLAVSIGVIS